MLVVKLYAFSFLAHSAYWILFHVDTLYPWMAGYYLPECLVQGLRFDSRCVFCFFETAGYLPSLSLPSKSQGQQNVLPLMYPGSFIFYLLPGHWPAQEGDQDCIENIIAGQSSCQLSLLQFSLYHAGPKGVHPKATSTRTKCRIWGCTSGGGAIVVWTCMCHVFALCFTMPGPS
jgi:hypothetical protein